MKSSAVGQSGEDTLDITFGAMAEPLKKQLAKFKLPAQRIGKWQRDADAITYLSVGGLLRDPEKTRARERLLRVIISAIKDSREG